jgi:UDP-N-acetylglucosamine pyrophosphorylase
MGILIDIILSDQPEIRDQSIENFCSVLSMEEILAESYDLELFRKNSQNLYHKVRALFFLYYIHRFYLVFLPESGSKAIIPYTAHENILNRRFEEAIAQLLTIQNENGVNQGISSALADSYRKLGFQTLTAQVRQSVRSTVGNSWMFRIGHPLDHPLRFRKELLIKDETTGTFPIIREDTPVRMDLSHSCWSDIFFLGMDFPEGARVLNISVDLCIAGTNETPVPPVEAWLRVIDEPVIRLVSTDLEATTTIRNISSVFNFAEDYLGLLKAAVIASGLIPPGMEGLNMDVATVLEKLVGPGLGFELVSQVNNIPKGSRLAVSTTLLASLVSACMRASRQTRNLTGVLNEEERRLVASKAILGEWLGGSGGGWQDSGGVWPGIKLIKGEIAKPGDPEYGISKGRLLPSHEILHSDSVSTETREKLQASLVVVHGGMAQNVGPILEMVTEKYLLRSGKEWLARKQAMTFFDEIVEQLKTGNIRKLGELTQRNFDGPISDIIPSVTNAYTEKIIAATKAAYGDHFWGFWMMGGMSGGGMGFIFDPLIRDQAKVWLLNTMRDFKKSLERSVPFAMDPVIYDFRINEKGTVAILEKGEKALMPVKYYTLMAPVLLKKEMTVLTKSQRKELELLGRINKTKEFYKNFMTDLFDRMIPQQESGDLKKKSLTELLQAVGFNSTIHDEIKTELKAGRIGLAQNRLPVSTKIADPYSGEVFRIESRSSDNEALVGIDAIKNGELAIVTLAGGIGTRWSQGAGIVKALHPFTRFSGTHRSFIDIHLAKNRKSGRSFGTPVQHVFTTSYLTHPAIEEYLKSCSPEEQNRIYLSPGKFVGLRLHPMERDLRFYWDELPHQILDEQAQKMRDNLQKTLINWTKQSGEGEDYTENAPEQCIHPVGHWFEIPNLMLNGTLKKMISHNPGLKYLMVHNVDTLGAVADPALLGRHINNGNAMTVEVISRWMDDRGGGLARVNDMLRLVEGLALPDEKTEFNLSYYNTNTFWITIDDLLKTFGLSRESLDDESKIHDQILEMARNMPSYVTIKEVKRRWGKGQEDIFPVTQFEKLWGDMTALPGIRTGYVEVPRNRGQQLKEIGQLDGWLKDGSAGYINSLCEWK